MIANDTIKQISKIIDYKAKIHVNIKSLHYLSNKDNYMKGIPSFLLFTNYIMSIKYAAIYEHKFYNQWDKKEKSIYNLSRSDRRSIKEMCRYEK